MIFILGGKGLVGSAFARACEASGRPYAVVDRESYPRYVGQHCSLLINANGNSRKPLAKQNPLAEFDASVRSVRASLVDFAFDTYVHLSSCDVYPDCSSPETTSEAQLLDPAQQSAYGFHKYLAEQCVRHAASNWLIFRLGGFVGPGLKKNAIYDILFGGKLYLDPDSELQFLHTEDAARIVLEIADSKLRGETFNLCGAGTASLREAMEWAGKSVEVQQGSPLVRYDVAISKIRKYAKIPRTRETVQAFVAPAP
jgi:nucleoside-diphosphate-sugar epimerase